MTVEVGGDNDFECRLTNFSEDVHCIGVIALQGQSAGDWVTVAHGGIWPVLCESGTYDRANYLVTDSTDGYAKETTSESAQPFAKIIEDVTISGSGLVSAFLHTIESY